MTKKILIILFMSGLCSAQSILTADVNGVTKLYMRQNAPAEDVNRPIVYPPIPAYIGIPSPVWGDNSPLTVTYQMYDDDANQNPELTYYDSPSGGKYTHYVDNTDGNATTTGTPTGYGSPEVPLNNIPQSLPAGSIVEVHGGPYTATTGGITKVQQYVKCNGTETYPIFVRGINRPVLNYQNKYDRFTFYGSYGILEGFEFDDCGLWTRYDDPIQSDHICYRDLEIVNQRSYGIEIRNVDDFVLYDSNLHDCNKPYYTQYLTGEDSSMEISDVNYLALSYYSTSRIDVGYVKFKMYREVGTTPGMITVTIKSTDADKKPYGVVRAIGMIDGNDITTDTDGAWYAIYMRTAWESTTGTWASFYISAEHEGIHCLTDSTSPTFPAPSPSYPVKFFETTDSGTTWTEDAGNIFIYNMWVENLHAIEMGTQYGGIRRIWILDNEFYNNGQDSIQTYGDSGDVTSVGQYIYIANNSFSGDFENAIDNKVCKDIIISQNTFSNYRSNTPVRSCIRLNDEDQRLVGVHNAWVIFNKFTTSRVAIDADGTYQPFYAIGNVIYNMDGTNPTGITSTTTAIRGIGTIGFVSEALYNIVYDCDNGINNLRDDNRCNIISKCAVYHANCNSPYVLEKNAFYNDGGAVTITGTATQTDNITADPCFADPENGDFTLDALSPVLSIGISTEARSVLNLFYTLYGIDITGYAENLFIEGINYAGKVD